MFRIIEDAALRISEIIDEPLDGDETERIGKLLTLKLDILQGNITPEEYKDGLRRLEKV